MQPIDTNEPTVYPNEQLLNIHPRLCTLHKWSHYDGYGIHLSRNKHPLGLRIDFIEPNSPAESGGLLREDIVLAVNGHSIENDDFLVILSCIQYALEQDQICFLVLDPNSAELAQLYQININENNDHCIRIETSQFIGSSNEVLNNQCRRINSPDQIIAQNLLDDTNKLSSDIDPKNNTKPELRMCSVTLRSPVDSIGISLAPDTDFGHIISEVEPNSPADRAGIEQDDYIISLNDTSLIYVPFEDALYFLKKNRHETKLNFLVAKKSYLLQSSQDHSTSNRDGEVILSSNFIEKNKSFTLPTTRTFKQIYHKYNYKQSERNRRRETITDEQYDRLSLQMFNNRSSAKHKKQHGKVLRGIGPANAHRFSWSAKSEKTIDYSSIRSDLYGRISGTNAAKKRSSSMKVAFNSLQVGMTNPSPTQPSRRIPALMSSISFSDDGKRTAQSPESIQRYYHSPEVLRSPSSAIRSTRVMNTPSPSFKHNQTIQNIRSATPIQPSSTRCIEEHDNSQISKSNLHLATVPISELSDHGYELLNIKLMQPTESIPLGFKLSKQTDSLQCVITGIDKQSKAAMAGLKVDDWLVKIEDNDIRLTNFPEISQNIYRIMSTTGSINILIARKRSTKPSLSVIDDQRTSALTAYDKSKETNALLSVGLSNKIEDKSQSKQGEYTINPSNDNDKDKIRNIILKEALGLDFYSFVPDQNKQIQIHSITNVRPLSVVYRAGLRNGDRILTVNDIDVTNTNHKTVRHRLLKKSPVHLKVINDPKYLELIENVKRKQNRITLSSSSNYEPVEEQQQQPSNLLSEDLVNVLFIDDKGPVYMKHCIVKKEPTYDSIGFVLRYINSFHTICDVEINMPAYNCGLRNEDVILCINKQNVERTKPDDVKILIRTLSLSNEVFNLILLNKNDMKRYQNFKEKSFIDWNNILSVIEEDDTNQKQGQQRRSYVSNISNKPKEISTPSLLSGARICILETSATRTAGFSISGEDKPPFIISKLEKDSPADRAGLQLNDAILSINGQSLVEVSYNETIEIIKEALQHKIVQIVVNQVPESQRHQRRDSSESSMTSSSEDSDASDAESTVDGDMSKEPCRRGANAIQQYQKLRSKELSYTVRLCHLSATNPDGTPASTFGFETTKEAKYEYPMISRVEPKLAGERSGLQARDLLIKVNGRKTKGVDIEKVKRAIEKAKHDGRLELLVIDEEVYRYGMRTNKKFKEPYIKVKHIFPRSRSSISFESLNSIAARASLASQDIINQLKSGSEFKVHRLSIPTDEVSGIKDGLSSSVLEETTDFDTPSSMNSSQQNYASSLNRNISNTPQKTQNQTSPDDSIVDSVLNTINNFFQNIGSEEPIKLDGDTPSEKTNHAPLQPTVHFERNLSEEIQHVSRVYNTTRSSGLYDYIRDPRRCLLKIDRNKGLGFVLSATGDYDHTITAVEKNSAADTAGLQVDDEVVEINNVDVRNVKYDQVVQMLMSALQTQDTIEMCVINSHLNEFFSAPIDKNKRSNIYHNNTDKNLITTTGSNLSYENSPIHSVRQQTINTSHPNLHNQSKYLDKITIRNLSGSVPALSTGITASPKDLRFTQSLLTSSKNRDGKILNVSKKEAPVARLCRIRKCPSSPFYGFFLCGDPKKLGRVYISNITKNSSAAICGLRNGDRIIEVNGTHIQGLTYETILNKIKLHMERHDLELLVLDKKSLRWYRERKFPITSRTLPTIVHIEPILNNRNPDRQLSQTHTNTSDQQESTTSL